MVSVNVQPPEVAEIDGGISPVLPPFSVIPCSRSSQNCMTENARVEYEMINVIGTNK